MTIPALEIINQQLSSLGLNYSFIRNNDNTQYPYYTGEYSEVSTDTEDGYAETTFMITGWSRGSWLDLQSDKALIENHFGHDGACFLTDDGSAVVVIYDTAVVVPTEDAELKKIQINLIIKEWMVV